MKITLQKAIDLIQASAAVIIKSDSAQPVIYAGIDDLMGENDNQFMNLYWKVGGCEYSMTFVEENNSEISIDGGIMKLEDDEGDLVELQLLFPVQLIYFCQKSDFLN